MSEESANMNEQQELPHSTTDDEQIDQAQQHPMKVGQQFQPPESFHQK